MPAFNFRLRFLFALIISGTVVHAQTWDTLATIPESFTFPVVVAVQGKIHIMGGGGTGGATTSHYAYDPSTDTWEQKANLPYAAQQPAGAATSTKIHFFGGGFPNSGSPLDDHYIYDVANDSWSQGAALPSPRAIHNAVAIGEDVYSIGGQGVWAEFLLYDADMDQWVAQPNLPDNQFWYGAHVVSDDRYFRFCGGGYTAPRNFAHSYEPELKFWQTLQPFPVQNHGLQGAAIDKKIYLTGGYHSFEERSEMWIYDVDQGSYQQSDLSLPIGRNYHRMVSIDGCIYILGGNHAIQAISDIIRTQMIRICPDETSSTRPTLAAKSLNAWIQENQIHIEIGDIKIESVLVELLDVSGKSIVTENRNTDAKGRLMLDIPNTVPGIYLIKAATSKGIYSGKVFIN